MVSCLYFLTITVIADVMFGTNLNFSEKVYFFQKKREIALDFFANVDILY